MKQTAVEYIKEKLICDEYWYENMTFEQIFEPAKDWAKDSTVSYSKKNYCEYVYNQE